jgi:hypothetical protein
VPVITVNVNINGGDDDILDSNCSGCNLLGAECMLKNSLQNN